MQEFGSNSVLHKSPIIIMIMNIIIIVFVVDVVIIAQRTNRLRWKLMDRFCFTPLQNKLHNFVKRQMFLKKVRAALEGKCLLLNAYKCIQYKRITYW